MAVRDISELAPDTRGVVSSYLDRLNEGFCGVDREMADDILADVRATFLESLDHASTPTDAQAIAEKLGEPDTYAASLCIGIEEMAPSGSSSDERAEPKGRVLGMPYDASVPTPDKLRMRIWNPDDSRIFTPRLVGLGWSVNFGAIAVKTGMIRPDDEDEPFGCVPEPWLWAALAVPVLISLATVAALTLSWQSLPEQLPSHWDVRGQVDGYSSAVTALLLPATLGLLGVAYAVWSFAVGKSKALRAVSAAGAGTFVIIGAGIVSAVLAWNAGIHTGWWWPWVMVLAALAVPFAVLVLLSRVGRAHEMKRDLG